MSTNLTVDSIKKLKETIEFLKYDIPKERFVTYEPSDLSWMIYFGLAKNRFMATHILFENNKAYMIDMNKYKIELCQ